MYNKINISVLGNILPEGSTLIYWTDKYEFFSRTSGATILSDFRRGKRHIFEMLLSASNINSKVKLLSVLLHEISHCVMHLSGQNMEIQHGKMFKDQVKRIIKKLKRNKIICSFFNNIVGEQIAFTDVFAMSIMSPSYFYSK